MGAVIAHRLGHLIAQNHLRIERGKRILKDHLHIAPGLAQGTARQAKHIGPVEHHLARLRLNQTQQGPPGRGFAATGFPHKAQRLAPVYMERDIFDRMDLRHGPAEKPALDRKAGGQVADLQQHLIAAGDGFRGLALATQQAHGFGGGFAPHLAQLGHGGQKRLGIIVLGGVENLFNRALFDLVTAEHDDDAIGHLRHHGHVMGDEHHRRAGFPFQPIHQRQDFRLDRHIKRSGRFIGNQQARFTSQSHGNHDALTHAAGQFMRVLRHAPFGFGDTHLAQQFDGPVIGLDAAHIHMQAQAFGQLPPDGENRVQRGHRLLKDHADLIAANRPHQGLIGACQINVAAVFSIKYQSAICDGSAAVFH